MNEVIPYFERLKLIKQGLLPKEAVAKPKKPIAKVSKKRKLDNKKNKPKEVDSEMDIWFAERRKPAMVGRNFVVDEELEAWFKNKMKLPKVCENCGARLDSLNEKAWHGSQHHILDKALFPSVKTHDLNHLVLGFYCCHSQWHTSIENAKKMPIWNHAKRKVQMFIDEVLENHKILEHYK